MKVHFPIHGIVFVLFSVLGFACQSNMHLTNYLFDFGTHASPVRERFTSVSPDIAYSSEQGYGWINNSFERIGFDLEVVKPANRMLQDGISATDSLVYRIDADPGTYIFTISIGKGSNDPMHMAVKVNDITINDSTSTPWLQLKYRTISQKVTLEKDHAIVTIATKNNNGVAVHGIELRPLVEWEHFETPTLLDQDTTAISLQRQFLRNKLIEEPTNIQIINQLYDLDKFLLATYYYDIGWWSWAVNQTGLSIFPRYHIASDLLRQIIADEDHPLYDKSVYLLARAHYWLYKEQGNEYNRESYEYYFDLLHDKHPEHRLLSMYVGENIIHESSCNTSDPNAPLWANYQREAICRMQEMIHWWADSAQADNGELGGKFGDDVEILRWWLPNILGADDQKARMAYTKLVDGVWNSGLLERAFSKKVEDVEHSAELFRDTHPAMFLMNYGNPIYVERCLVSMQNFRDTWTGINSHGHRHFKSCYLSASAIDETPPYAVDVPLNARATLPGLWAAWYNQNPTTIQLFTEWGNAWVEDAARSDNGKPAGLMPAAVAYKDERIGGYAPEWYNPGEGLGWDYFDWESLGHVGEMYNQLLGLYAITGQKSLLNPMNSTFDFMMAHGDPQNINETTPGSEDWAAAQLWGKTFEGLSPDGNIMELYGSARALIGTDRYDELIKKAGRHYSQYRLTGEEEYVEEGLKAILETIRYNYPLYTREVKFTDRVDVPYVDLLFGMYTGHIGSGFEFPGLSATWKNTGPDIAILVGESNHKSLQAQLFNFGTSKAVGMYTWQLKPGQYELVVKRKSDGKALAKQLLEISERTSYVEFEIPSNELVALQITQQKEYKGLSFPRVDLAITPEDIKIAGNWDQNGAIPIEVTIHNIGNKDAGAFMVSILDVNGEDILASQTVKYLEAPNDLNPRLKTIKLSIPGNINKQEILVDVKMDEPEITLVNNKVHKNLKR